MSFSLSWLLLLLPAFPFVFADFKSCQQFVTGFTNGVVIDDGSGEVGMRSDPGFRYLLSQYSDCISLMHSVNRPSLSHDIIVGVHYPLRVFEIFGKLLVVPATDAVIGPYMKYTGTFDPFEKKTIISLIDTARQMHGTQDSPITIIEAGANIGAYAHSIAKYIGQESLLHCFEPFRIYLQVRISLLTILPFFRF
jgi:hypothetical protein